jgi:hypothetical protein
MKPAFHFALQPNTAQALAYTPVQYHEQPRLIDDAKRKRGEVRLELLTRQRKERHRGSAPSYWLPSPPKIVHGHRFDQRALRLIWQ